MTIEHKNSPPKLYQTILSATCGSLISTLSVTPLEVIKTRMVKKKKKKN